LEIKIGISDNYEKWLNHIQIEADLKVIVKKCSFNSQCSALIKSGKVANQKSLSHIYIAHAGFGAAPAAFQITLHAGAAPRRYFFCLVVFLSISLSSRGRK
jgi:hypothetical protein